jgi:hypothetical protein
MPSFLPTHALRVSIVASLAVLLALTFASSTRAGSYIVVQCSPGLFADGEPSYSFSTNHFAANRDCSKNSPGFQIRHRLPEGATGTAQGRFGAWVWQAPAGTVISGGSVYSRLQSDDGVTGFLAVSPDVGDSKVTENQNDGKQHLSAIPAGQWRYFVARLQCTNPNQNGRCIGGSPAAHTYVKQLRLQLTDQSPPQVGMGGPMLSGTTLRGRQTLAVLAGDQGSGIYRVEINVNGKVAASTDLGSFCNLLPGGLTSRMSPCPVTFGNHYSLDTAAPPFKNGTNLLEVCVSDYAQQGQPNLDCESDEIEVDSLCPTSPVGGGAKLNASFAPKGKRRITVRHGHRVLIRGRVRDEQGNPLTRAQICVLGRPDLPNKHYRLIGVASTNDNGRFSYTLKKGASRQLRVAYRNDAFQLSRSLKLRVRSSSTIKASHRNTRPGKRVQFNGRIPGPHSSRRVVVLYGTVPGANRRFLVRRARTDHMGRWHARYSFTPVPGPTKFVFWAVIPDQNGYPFARGRSPHRIVRVTP